VPVRECRGWTDNDRTDASRVQFAVIAHTARLTDTRKFQILLDAPCKAPPRPEAVARQASGQQGPGAPCVVSGCCCARDTSMGARRRDLTVRLFATRTAGLCSCQLLRAGVLGRAL